jgi:polysaccharide deacetylase 2 family uncharacterized protein YibQ
MVARGFERGRQAREHAFAVMMDVRYFAMERFGGADDIAAESLPHRLKAEADSEQRDVVFGTGFNEGEADSGMVRIGRAGGNHDAIRLEREGVFDCDFIVAVDKRFRAQIAQILDQVVGEGIVIIDQQDHGKCYGAGVDVCPVFRYIRAMKPRIARSGTIRFIIISVIFMLLADHFVFGGKRSYIEDAKERGHEKIEAEKKKEPPVRVMPGDGKKYFEAPVAAEVKTPEKKEAVKPLAVAPPNPPYQAVEGNVKRSGHPKIAIIIDDLGMDIKHTKEVLELPAPVTLAFLPYAPKTRELAAAGRAKGHALIIHVPMEAGMSYEAFDAAFRVMLASFDGYAGINNHMGSRLTQDKPAMDHLMKILAEKKLFFLDSKTIQSSVAAHEAMESGVAYAERDVFLDHVETGDAVRAALAHAEKIAQRKGYAIAIGHPKGFTIEALKAWIPTLKDKGIELVPVRALLNAGVKPSLKEDTGAAVVVPEAISPGLAPLPKNEEVPVEALPQLDMFPEVAR